MLHATPTKLLAPLWALTVLLVSTANPLGADQEGTFYDLRTKRTGADKNAFSFRHNKDGIFKAYTTLGVETSSWNAATGTFTGTWGGTFPASSLTGQVQYNQGGTGLSTVALGDILYGASGTAWAKLGGNTIAGKRFLCQTGTGSVSAAPSWLTIALSDLPTVDVTKGGTGVTSLAAGYILYGNGTGTMTALPPGTNAQVLTMNGTTALSWQDPAGGGGGGHTQNTDTGTDSDSFVINTDGSTGELHLGNGSYPLVLSHSSTTGNTGIISEGSLTLLPNGGLVLGGAVSVFTGSTWDFGSVVPVMDGSSITNINPAALSAPVPPTLGGTGFSSVTLGDVIYGTGANDWSTIAGNSSTAKKFFTMTGTGTTPAAPAWTSIVAGDLPSEAVRTDTVQTITGAKNMNSASNAFAGDGTALTIAPGNLNAPVPVTKGGLNRTSAAVGEIPYASSTSAYAGVTPNATTTNKFLTQSGNGTSPSAPVYATIQSADLPAINLATGVTGTLGPTNGGTGQATWTAGDLLYASATNILSKRAIGAAGYVLKVAGGMPTWAAHGLQSVLDSGDSATGNITLTGSMSAATFTGPGAAFDVDSSGNTAVTSLIVGSSGDATIDSSGNISTQGTISSVSGISGTLLPIVSSDSGGFTADPLVSVYFCNGTFTVQLPTPTAAGTNPRWTFKNTGTGTLTFDPAGSVTIDGAATKVSNTQYETLEVLSDGTNYFIL